MRNHFVVCLSAIFALMAGCSSSVEIAGTSSSGSGGAGTCMGNGPICAWGCGSDASSQADCKDGTWVCPPGTVDSNTCPPGTCWGPPLSCEVCNNGWTCAPASDCIGPCFAQVCATCNGAPDIPLQIGVCTCSCKNGIEYGCSLLPGCCNSDVDCGDKQWFPCINNVCKQPVMGQCWVDAECGPGMKCQGAVVCPCNYDCDVPDSPGMCVPG